MKFGIFFRIAPTEKRATWLEAIEQIGLMITQSPYRGFEGLRSRCGAVCARL